MKSERRRANDDAYTANGEICARFARPYARATPYAQKAGVAPGTIASTCELADAKSRAPRAAVCASARGWKPRVPRNVQSFKRTVPVSQPACSLEFSHVPTCEKKYRPPCLGGTEAREGVEHGHTASTAMDDTSRGGPGGAPAGGEGSEPPAASADAETRALPLPPSSQSSPVFPAGSPPRGGEETCDPFVDDAHSPPSPRPRIAARAPPRRAKTPPTFEDCVLPRPSADDSPSREETVRGAGKSESAEAKANAKTTTTTTATETNPYPLSFLFPGGRLYREPPPREPRRENPDLFDIPDDFERLAVDPEAPEEVRRLTRHRGLRRIAEARAALRVGSKKRSRSPTDLPPSESGLCSVLRGPSEDDEDDEDEDEDTESEEDEDASRTTTSAPRVLPPASPEEKNPKRPRMLAGIRTPVKGFRTPRANESATVAATMAMADAELAARSPPRPTPFTVGSVVVIRVGRIDLLRSPRFSSASSYLLPIGFTSRRKYASVASPGSRVWYESTVEPGGDEPRRLGDFSPPETTPATAAAAKSPPKSPPKSPYTTLDAYDSNGSRNDSKQTTDGPARSVSVVVRECDSGVTNPATFTGRSPTDAWQKVIRAVNETARTRARSSVSGPQFLGLSSPVVAAEIAKLPGYAEARAELEERRRRRGHDR